MENSTHKFIQEFKLFLNLKQALAENSINTYAVNAKSCIDASLTKLKKDDSSLNEKSFFLYLQSLNFNDYTLITPFDGKGYKWLQEFIRIKLNRKYWALGFGSGEYYKRLEQFKSQNYWQALDYEDNDLSNSAQRARKKFNQIKIGDLILIKGFGGSHDLNIHYYGLVSDIDQANKKISLKKIDRPLLKEKAPSGPNAGNWHDTIVEITRPKDIIHFFDDRPIGIYQYPLEYNVETKIMNLNTILFGPPGTGKTHSLQKDYFPLFKSSGSSATKDEYFINKINEFSWWEVIAAALLDLKSAKVAEIANHPLVKYKTDVSVSSAIKPVLWQQLQTHTIETCELVRVSRKSSPLIFNKKENSIWEVVADTDDEAPRILELLEEYNHFSNKDEKEIIRYRFVTFHQSYSYEDFIEGIKPDLGNNIESKEVSYSIQDGIFKELCLTAEKDPENKYALFIDEINRGNVSAIFGELITLIEDDKRKNGKHPVSTTLTYSKKPFTVPSNVYIFGTMNTADRSVEALDTALRRRFSFIEMMPDYSSLENQTVGSVKLADLLFTINKRLKYLLNEDHQIGHSYFLNLDGDIKELKRVFKNNIIPLLKEYFYNDAAKIQLVIGEGFVSKIKNGKPNFAIKNHDEDFEKDIYEFKILDNNFDIEIALNSLGIESILV